MSVWFWIGSGVGGRGVWGYGGSLWEEIRVSEGFSLGVSIFVIFIVMRF